MPRRRALPIVVTVFIAAGAVAGGAKVSADAMAPAAPADVLTIGIATLDPDDNGNVIRCEFEGVDPTTLSFRRFERSVPPGAAAPDEIIGWSAGDPADSGADVPSAVVTGNVEVRAASDAGGSVSAPAGSGTGNVKVDVTGNEAAPMIDAPVTALPGPGLPERIFSSVDERPGTGDECAAIKAKALAVIKAKSPDAGPKPAR